ncbi:MAG: hypothetical protein RLO48_07730, partial [Bauldia litoralis]
MPNIRKVDRATHVLSESHQFVRFRTNTYDVFCLIMVLRMRLGMALQEEDRGIHQDGKLKLRKGFQEMRIVILVLLAAVAGLSCEANAQQPPDPTMSTGTPQVLPRPDYHFNGNVGRTYLESDTPKFPQPVKAPDGAPNVVLILIDDAGFGQFSAFG